MNVEQQSFNANISLSLKISQSISEFGSLVAIFGTWLVEHKCDILLLCYQSAAFLHFGVSMFIYVQRMDVKCVHECSQETR